MQHEPNITIKFKILSTPVWFIKLFRRVDFILLSWTPDQKMKTLRATHHSEKFKNLTQSNP